MIEIGYRCTYIFYKHRKCKCRVWLCDYVDTLCFCLKDGLIWLISMLHSNGMWELIQHSLLEGLQPFIVMSSANKFLILSGTGKQKARASCMKISGIQTHVLKYRFSRQLLHHLKKGKNKRNKRQE